MLRGADLSTKHVHPKLLNETTCPRALAWLERLNGLVAETKERVPVDKLSEVQTVKLIEEAEFWDGEKLDVLDWDPTGVERGVEVDVFTTDTPSGFQNKGTGELLGMAANKVIISGKTKAGVDVRIHYPRTNVKIAKASGRP